MSNRAWSRARPVGFLLAALSILACVGGGSERCACGEASPCPAATLAGSTAASSQPAVTDGSVYLDMSVTMQGFISDQSVALPFTDLQRLLRTTLREAFVAVDLPDPRFFGFGAEIFDAPAPMPHYATRSPDGRRPRGRFTQSQTDVVNVLEQTATAPGSLSVIITDNAQDVLGSHGRRATGFDRASFVKVLTESLHASGFGIWLVGLLNEYEGTYFSITPVFDQQGIRVNHPIYLDAPRPVYLWVVSRDHEKGRRFVAYLYRRLLRDGGHEASPDGPVQAIELAPGLQPEVQILEPEGYEDEAAGGEEAEPGRGDGVRSGDGVWRERHFFRVRDWRPTTERSTAACLSFEAAEQSRPHRVPLITRLQPAGGTDSWTSLPLDVWDVVYEVEEGGLGVKIRADGGSTALAAGPVGERHHELEMFPALLANRAARDWRVDLVASVQANPDALPENHWTHAWSTNDDTSRESVEGKTLYLEDLVEGVLRATAGEPRDEACLRLCFLKEG